MPVKSRTSMPSGVLIASGLSACVYVDMLSTPKFQDWPFDRPASPGGVKLTGFAKVWLFFMLSVNRAIIFCVRNCRISFTLIVLFALLCSWVIGESKAFCWTSTPYYGIAFSKVSAIREID
jgi:uncharacterized membrane protein YjgN (DUF898 family)